MEIMSSVCLLLLLLSLLVASALSANEEAFVGVNIGTDVSDMPSPTQVVALLKAQRIHHVRLFDADQAMLLALANTGIHVTVSVPNDQLLGIGQSNSTAANWVSRNVLSHVPATNITAIAIGSEVLTTLPNAAPVLVSAMKFIHSALVAANLDSKIKVSTPHSSSIVLDWFPPSQAFFNRSLDPVMVPLLNFLKDTGSHLMLNVYPYYNYMKSDAYFSMSYLNFTNIPIMVTESGWPSKGDSSEPDASLDNANTYNSNLIKHVLNNTGTPKHPGIAVSTYIYELYNEDLRPGSISEKNWGLFDSSGMPVYTLHLTGSGMVLANYNTNQTYCVAKENAEKKMVQAALDWACGPGKVDCTPLLQENPCYEPNTVIAHASYAFDAYYHKMGMADGTCDFNGVARVTTSDPSNGSCIYPGSGGRNGTFKNSSPLAPSSNTTASGCHSQYSNDRIFFSSFIVGLIIFWTVVSL
ncbi:glucan endo-1,3-beta-glucosidase 3-like isoform X2 [Lycium ferocissimum]|uniref:glucan endo-1,3-beta-glucosidase 3-like isoform X2 n=1 Tax=Lycium ferocissimum TaxID=112874 RepID=UPI002815855D|nr:glucan endo-1,3-beta-glucosidase 3-like isoform X2 [Lycium ferocissimum]